MENLTRTGRKFFTDFTLEQSEELRMTKAQFVTTHDIQQTSQFAKIPMLTLPVVYYTISGGICHYFFFTELFLPPCAYHSGF